LLLLFVSKHNASRGEFGMWQTKTAARLASAIAIGFLPAFSMAQNVSTSAPLATDSAGRGGAIAVSSVFRVICPEQNSYGTGFLHKSHFVITAAHVVDNCTKIVIALPDNKTSVSASVTKMDERLDLAIIEPTTPLPGTPLRISSLQTLSTGQQIAIWGFPVGYIGVPPMVSVGYFSGADAVKTKAGEMVGQMVVNAAVNHGDSGAPVVLVETGEVIGVADNKIVPLSDIALSALAALTQQQSGFIYPARLPDGTTKNFSEGQVVAMVLEELRQQVQLVVGHAVWAGDLRAFLQTNNIDP
jgi:S1-C subfamily serine protease